jgi:hypothetical protein
MVMVHLHMHHLVNVKGRQEIDGRRGRKGCHMVFSDVY